MTEHDSHLFTVAETAAYLRISKDLTYDLIRRGELRPVKIGRIYRIPRLALENWIALQAGLPLNASVEVTSPAQRQEH